MQLKFDPNQQFQLDVIKATTDLFNGLPLLEDNFSVSVAQEKGVGMYSAQSVDILAFGNHAMLPEDTLLNNLKAVQRRGNITESTEILKAMGCPQFSIEMETGTGKTYVYLRTIHELHTNYGYSKFVIVVPGKAIREGTLKNLEITSEHFRNLYSNTPFSYSVYDSNNMSIVRDFTVSRGLSILLINIEAFRRDFNDEEDFDIEKGVLFHRPNEKLSGRSPREFIQAVHPIVIIDEPQSVDNSPIAKKSVSLLNPLFTLRYSATHRNPYNLIYRLDPIQAYAMRLVKKVAVAEVLSVDGPNSSAYIKLIGITNTDGIRAKIEIDEDGEQGPKRKIIKVKNGDDIYEKSRHRETYQNGFVVGEISAEDGKEFIQFEPSGIHLNIGEAHGGDNEAIKRLQIIKTIEEHFEKEIELKDKGIKVLTLFFLDRVSNYRVYPEEGESEKGPYAKWFEEEYERLRKLDKYSTLSHPPVEKVHDGYFAQDNNGNLKESRGEGDTVADESAYNKIMKEKEKLLSFNEPLKFIFSHSALREGWDNPNIFQICTLNQTTANIKKRQEIGRGMRLPVNQDGVRIFDDSINKLVVIANESYKDFAKKLQTEYEEDCGVTFGKITKSIFANLSYEKGGTTINISNEDADLIIASLKTQGMIDERGILTDLFTPFVQGFTLMLPDQFKALEFDIIDLVSRYRLENHIIKHENKLQVTVNDEIYNSDDFKELWNRIKTRTTYGFQFSGDSLVTLASEKIRDMPQIQPPKVQYIKADFSIDNRGVTPLEVRNSMISIDEGPSDLPDILSYLQRATHLRRQTLIEILLKSNRLSDFPKNPQCFMDLVVDCITQELHRLSIEGIKYEPIEGDEFEMQLFKNNEFYGYLNELVSSGKSIYKQIQYDSEVEHRFARELENKEYIKLYVKLPSWFTIDTPIGKYNPDWAIVKHDDKNIYFVRETKGTIDENKLRESELQKIKCGTKHFSAIGMDDFKVVIDANEI